MKTLLVTGASGFLGWNVCHYPQDEWRIVGTWNKNKAGIQKNWEKIQLDLTDKNAVREVFKEIRPDAVFHLAAISGTNFCEKNPEISYPINVNAAQYLTEFCYDNGVAFLFISSGQIYDGLAPFYDENSTPNPKNIYGKQKVEAEKFISENYKESLICRVPVMFGKPSPTAQNFADNWIKSWKKGESITAFYDEIRSFLSGQKAAEALFFLLKKGGEGKFNIGGEEPLNRVEFAKLMAETLKIANAEIVEKSQKETEMPAYRPPRVVFNNLKIKDMGFSTGFVEDEILKAFLC